MSIVTCSSKRDPHCMGQFHDWDKRGVCIPCHELAKVEATELERAKVLGQTYRGNVIHWSTIKGEGSKQEAWGNRNYQSVILSSDMEDLNKITDRVSKAIKARYPFNPTYCTNQHSGLSVESMGSGKFVAKWETYHSIGD